MPSGYRVSSTRMAEPPLHRLARAAVTLPRSSKRLVMLIADAFALPLCFAGAIWLVTPEIQGELPFGFWLISLLIGIPAMRFWGFYRSVVRFMGLELLEAAVKSVTLAVDRVVAVRRVGRQLAGRRSRRGDLLVPRNRVHRRQPPDGTLVAAVA